MGKVKRKKYGIRLHLEHDKDILARLEEVDSKAGYIKELIKRDIMRGGRNDSSQQSVRVVGLKSGNGGYNVL